jgi:hypothetical protein
VALNNTERRRILLATTLTFLALPALWWANQSEGASAPNIATVGVDVGAEGESAGSASGEATPAAQPDQLGKTDPVFLDGPAGDGGGAAEIAVPAAPRRELITTSATFSSKLPSTTRCLIPGIAIGSQITVVNLDNNRSTTCVTLLAPSGSNADLVLHTSTFAELADLTDAPIPVEIRL